MDKETRFVDANIFLEVFLKDKNWESAAKYLGGFARGESNGVTSDFVVFSILLQIHNKTKSIKFMEDFVTFLGNLKTLKIAHFTLGILTNAASIMGKYGLDFDDSLQASFMGFLGLKEIVSFDRDFDGIDWIKRVEPSELTKE